MFGHRVNLQRPSGFERRVEQDHPTSLAAQVECDVTVATESAARTSDAHLEVCPRWYPLSTTLEVCGAATKIVHGCATRASCENEREKNAG